MEDKYSILKKNFGYTSFKYPQDLVIDSVMENKDTIAILPTGFGKSITFQIPALMLDGLTIVISPLIALMIDQVESLRKKNISAKYLNSSLNEVEVMRLYSDIENDKIKILYVSAERLQNSFFLKRIKSKVISLIVIDEAHTILWGEDFREAFLKISLFINIFQNKPRVLAITATATTQTINKISNYLELTNPNIITSNIDRSNLFYKVYQVNDKNLFIINYLKKHNNTRGIIYCLTRKKVDQLFCLFNSLNIPIAKYHGGMSSLERNNNYLLFKENKVKAIICTNAFGMGIDLPDIRYVINYEIPQSLEDLVQEMGRTSRDGGYGEGILLFSFKDLRTIYYFIDNLKDKKLKTEAKRKASLVIDYALTKKCRHQFICSYFGTKQGKCKSFCDNCSK